jgi:hypothetical protein
MDGWMDCLNAQLLECSIIGMLKRSNTWLGGWIDEMVNNPMDGSMNHCITGSMDTSMNHWINT